MKSNMFKQNVTKIAVLAAALAGVLTASAADITWTEQYLTSANGTEVSTKGTGLDAMSFGNVIQNGSDVTINGVTFTANTNSNPSSTYYSSLGTAGIPDFYSAGLAIYDTLLSGAIFASDNNLVTLRNLTVGQEYQVQLFIADDRTSNENIKGRKMIMDWNTDNVYTSAVFGVNGDNSGDGIVINGAFIADATTQTFTMNVLNGNDTVTGRHLNAYQLRNITTGIAWTAQYLTAAGTEVMAKWTLLEALNFTPPAYPVSPTINGVTFTAFTDSTDPAATYFSTTSDNIVTGGSRYLNGFAVYADLLARFIWDGDAANATVTLSGLTVGRVYQVQLFMADENVNAAARTMIMDMGLANEFACPAYGDNNADGYVINGTFTADATIKTFTMNNGGTAGLQISAYQLRVRPPQGTVIQIL